ncbi:bleomycin hydrolase [Mucor velutinosus]|uniref:Bleomycin hydrolase n=1 Tax=Mucor velutinosus TaxID=708070 RepID=A0AAN7DKL7_9FUNG|nr:bleomycin hydrolase [Mucor velutinosus]
MGEENVVVATAGPTLTSVQVALIAMGVVACSSFVLAVYIWGRSLVNQRRERMLDNATTTAAAEIAAEERVYRQQQQYHHVHDYARSTIHDTSLLQQHRLRQQPAYTNNTAYFVHNGLPLPPTYRSEN